MPRCVRRLKNAALLCIAKNIDYWTEMIPEDAESYLYLLSPFEILDYGLTQLIFDALIKYNTFQPKHIHLLFHQQLDSFDLSRLAAYKLGDVTLKTLFKRCKKIKTLILSGRTRFSRKLLSSIPLRYANLQSLVTTHESITDHMISNLAFNCKKLSCFQSGTCSNISDEAFEKLAMLPNLSVLSLGNADRLSGKTLLLILESCKKLYRLSLPMTSLDFKFLDEGCLFESVVSLDFTLGPIDDISMERITFSFPNITDICVSNCEKVTTHSLRVIGNNCVHIESLNISYTGITQYSHLFEAFLKKSGRNMHFLDVSGMSDVNTAIFGKYCKRLEKLCMNHCSNIVTEWLVVPVRQQESQRSSTDNERVTDVVDFSLLESCPSLISLQIDARNMLAENGIFDLEALLRGGHLKSLSLNSIPFLTDNDIANIIECMEVDQLRCLNLSGNNHVTLDGIWLAIDSLKTLETIKISGCDIVTMEFDNLQKEVLLKGFEVQVIR